MHGAGGERAGRSEGKRGGCGGDGVKGMMVRKDRVE